MKKDVLIVAPFTQLPGEAGNGRFHYIAQKLDKEKLDVELVTTDFSHRKKAHRNVSTEALAQADYHVTVSYTHLISRKNFLFCITPRGAKASAITFSLIESAKENDLKPFEYLEYLLKELPSATTKDLDRFMPWSEDIPDYCRTSKTK